MSSAPSLPVLILRSDFASRRAWLSVPSLVYYLALVVFLLVDLYIAARSAAYRALAITLVCVAVAFELGLWQWRRESTHRMEDGGSDLVAQLFAHERPPSFTADNTTSGPGKAGKEDPLSTGPSTQDTGEEMVLMVMRERPAVEDVVCPLPTSSGREDHTVATKYQRVRSRRTSRRE